MNVDKTQAMPVGIGAVAGLGIGAGAGAVVASKKPAAADYKKAINAFAEQRDSFVGATKNYKTEIDSVKAFVEKHDSVKAAEEKLADAQKVRKELASDVSEKVKKAKDAAVDAAQEKLVNAKRKAGAEFIGKEENKKIKSHIDTMVSKFKEGKGKELLDTADKAKKALKNTRVKWIAGLAAAGVALGAGAGILFNKVKASKAEKEQ